MSVYYSQMFSFLDTIPELAITVSEPSPLAWVALACSVLLLVCSGLASASEIAFFSLSPQHLAEIAEEIGFCNANYFHKIFKQYMGQSPLAYRKGAK